MKIENEIKINQFAQNISTITEIINYFNSLAENEKVDFLQKLVYFILQLRPEEEIITEAIKFSGLKETFTPSILIKKGINYNNLQKILSLPKNEFDKSLSLLLSLYFLAYQKQFTTDDSFQPNKWWLSDLSDTNNIEKIRALNNFQVIIKRIYSRDAIETGCIMTAMLPFNITIYEKNLVEKRLELYAFNELYPKNGLNIYKSIYNDTASLTIIREINNLPSDNIRLAIY